MGKPTRASRQGCCSCGALERRCTRAHDVHHTATGKRAGRHPWPRARRLSSDGRGAEQRHRARELCNVLVRCGGNGRTGNRNGWGAVRWERATSPRRCRRAGSSRVGSYARSAPAPQPLSLPCALNSLPPRTRTRARARQTGTISFATRGAKLS